MLKELFCAVGVQNKPDLSAHWFEPSNSDVFFHFLSWDCVMGTYRLMIDGLTGQLFCHVTKSENATA